MNISQKLKDRRQESAFKLCRIFHENGLQALFAGGCVRDFLLNIPPKDFDIVTAASLETIQKLLIDNGLPYIPVGQAFGVVRTIVDGFQFEIAKLRTDGAYSDGRRPDSVSFTVSLEADAARRDLTINSMFYDPVDGKVLDCFNGQHDLAYEVIKAVGNPYDRFNEDYLRMLRVIRFSGRFPNPKIDTDTLLAILDNREKIASISKERIAQELSAALDGPFVTRTFQLFEKIFGFPFKNIEYLSKVKTNFSNHLEKKTYLFACLLSFGGLSINLSWARDYKLTTVGVNTDLLEKLNKHLYFISLLPELDYKSKYFLLELPEIEDFLAFHDCIGGKLYDYGKKHLANIANHPVETRRLSYPLFISGKTLLRLGIKQGPHYSEIINKAKIAQKIEGKIRTKEEAEEWIKQNYSQYSVVL